MYCLFKEIFKRKTKKDKILSFHVLSAIFLLLPLSCPTAASCKAGDTGWTQWLSF